MVPAPTTPTMPRRESAAGPSGSTCATSTSPLSTDRSFGYSRSRRGPLARGTTRTDRHELDHELDGDSAMNATAEQFTNRHRETLDRALEAIRDRAFWT